MRLTTELAALSAELDLYKQAEAALRKALRAAYAERDLYKQAVVRMRHVVEEVEVKTLHAGGK